MFFEWFFTRAIKIVNFVVNMVQFKGTKTNLMTNFFVDVEHVQQIWLQTYKNYENKKIDKNLVYGAKQGITFSTDNSNSCVKLVTGHN